MGIEKVAIEGPHSGYEGETGFTLLRQVYVRREVPEVRHSERLSRETGLHAGILDYGICDQHTHKTALTRKLMIELRKQGRRIILAINPSPDPRENTFGSLDDNLALDSAVYFPESQVVSVVHSEKPYSRITPINPRFPESRYRVEIGLPLDEFVGRKRLKEFFYNSMSGQRRNGDNLNEWYVSSQSRDVKNFLLKSGIDATDKDLYADVTNAGDEIAYVYPEELRKKIKDECTYLVGPIGTGKRFLDQITSLKDEGIVHVGIVPKGHALDPVHEYEGGIAERLNNPYLVSTLRSLVRASAGRKDVLFKYVTDEEIRQAQQRMRRILREEFPDSRTGYSGAVAASVLKSRFNPREKKYFDNGLGIFVPHAYKIIMRQAKFGVMKGGNDFILPFETGVLLVNTGDSSLSLLKQLIAHGMILAN